MNGESRAFKIPYFPIFWDHLILGMFVVIYLRIFVFYWGNSGANRWCFELMIGLPWQLTSPGEWLVCIATRCYTAACSPVTVLLTVGGQSRSQVSFQGQGHQNQLRNEDVFVDWSVNRLHPIVGWQRATCQFKKTLFLLFILLAIKVTC